MGPNCLGHISTFNNLNASFADGFPAKGNVTFISQSGAYCSAMLDWAEKKGIGFSNFISIGNKAVMGEDKLLDALKDDPNTTAFVFYLESLKNGKEFIVRADYISEKNKYVKAVYLNGKKLNQFKISHYEIIKGGTLNFVMTDEPIKTF